MKRVKIHRISTLRQLWDEIGIEHWTYAVEGINEEK